MVDCYKGRAPGVFIVFSLLQGSGVARLGHTGAHALATRGCAPPVQVCIGTDSIIVNRESATKQSSNRTVQNYESRMHEFAV